MASITKHPNSRFFTACYTNREGKQVKRSTKQTNRNNALEIAISWENLEKSARNGTLTTVQIHKVMNDLSEKVNGDQIKLPSVEVYFNDWAETKESNGAAAGTVERYKNTIKMFLKSLGDKSKMPINGLAPLHIKYFSDKRLKEGSAPKTVIVDLKTLSTALNEAEALMLILKNPVKAIQLPKNVSSEREIFTYEDVSQILSALNSMKDEKSMDFVLNWKMLILLGFYTGARLSDCVKLTSANLDLNSSVLNYTQQKTGKEVRVPLHIDLYVHIQEVLGFRHGEYQKGDVLLCGELAKKGTGGKSGLSETFLQIIKKAGIETKTIQGKGNKKFNCLSFHSLRHGFNTILFNNGTPQEVRMKLTGHSSVNMNNRYLHQDMTHVTKAVKGIRSITPEDD